MEWIDGARYGLALFILIALPPGVVFWYVIHPFARFWRRLGPIATYTLVTALMALLGWQLFRYREPLLAREYGASLPLAVLGLACYAVAIVIEIHCRRQLKLSILVGLPEVSRRRAGKLLTEGIYAHTRNPRYLSMVFALLAFALLSNYLALYVLTALSVPALHVLVLLEERELRQRFGEEYERYLRSVPRFVPRLR